MQFSPWRLPLHQLTWVRWPSALQCAVKQEAAESSIEQQLRDKEAIEAENAAALAKMMQNEALVRQTLQLGGAEQAHSCWPCVLASSYQKCVLVTRQCGCGYIAAGAPAMLCSDRNGAACVTADAVTAREGAAAAGGPRDADRGCAGAVRRVAAAGLLCVWCLSMGTAHCGLVHMERKAGGAAGSLHKIAGRMQPLGGWRSRAGRAVMERKVVRGACLWYWLQVAEYHQRMESAMKGSGTEAAVAAAVKPMKVR